MFFLDDTSNRYYNALKVPYKAHYSFDYFDYGKRSNTQITGPEKTITKKTIHDIGYIFYIHTDNIRELVLGGSITHTDIKYGYALNDGTVTIKPLYDSMDYFTDNSVKAAIYINKVFRVEGYLSYDGSHIQIEDNHIFNDYLCITNNELNNTQIDLITPYYSGFAVCVQNGKMGVISKSYNIVVPAIYDTINRNRSDFNRWHFNKYEGEYRGVINMERVNESGMIEKHFAIVRGNTIAKIITNGEADWIYCLNSGFGYIAVSGQKSGQKRAFYSINGEQLLPFKYDRIWDISKGIIEVELNGKIGLFKIAENSIEAHLDFIFDWANGDYLGTNKYGIAVCALHNNEYVFYNQKLERVDSIKDYQNGQLTLLAHTYGEGLVGCRNDDYDKEYFVNMYGEEYIPTCKLSIMSIEEGFVKNKATVKLYSYNSKGLRDFEGYYLAQINKEGEILSQRYIACEMREHDGTGKNYSDIEDLSDAYEGDSDAYWNTD